VARQQKLSGAGLSVTSLLTPWMCSSALCLLSKYKTKSDETGNCEGQWERMCCGKGHEL